MQIGQKVRRVSAKGRYSTTLVSVAHDENGVDYLKLRIDGMLDPITNQPVIQEVVALGFQPAPELVDYTAEQSAAKLAELFG